MRDYLKEFEEHLNDVTKNVLDEAPGPGYEASPMQKKLANYGRILMDQAVTTKNDELSNVMAKVGDALTRFGTAFGPRDLNDLIEKTGTSENVIRKLLAFAEKIADTHTAIDKDDQEGGLDDEGDDEFTQASDDEMAAMADRAARAKR